MAKNISTASAGRARPTSATPTRPWPQAIAEQASRLISCPEMFYNDRRAALEEKLCRLAGMGSVFLCNSGTEAVEAAVKFARLLTKRTGIVAAMRGFHGRTMGALSATWERNTASPSDRWCPGFSHVPITTCEALRAAVTDTDRRGACSKSSRAKAGCARETRIFCSWPRSSAASGAHC